MAKVLEAPNQAVLDRINKSKAEKQRKRAAAKRRAEKAKHRKREKQRTEAAKNWIQTDNPLRLALKEAGLV